MMRKGVTCRSCITGRPLLLTPCSSHKCKRLLRPSYLRSTSNTDPACEVSESVVTVRTTSSLQNGLKHTTRVEEIRRTTTTTAPSPDVRQMEIGDCKAQQLLCMAEAPPPGSLAASSLMGKGLSVSLGSLLLGVVLTLGVQFGVALLTAHQSTSKVGRWLSIQQRRWKKFAEGGPVTASSSEFTTTPEPPEGEKPGAMVLFQDQGESVEWVNMCWRKIWRVYQRGLERWIMDLLQPLFDMLVKETGYVPTFLQRIKIVEFTLDHEAPYFSNMRRRTSRKDSDLSGVVDVRYTGGARMLLMLEVGQGRWKLKIPVMVSDLDLECKMWVKIRLAPICPWLGQISLAFVGPPTVKVQLSPYNRVRLMRIPVLQTFLSKLLTVDLPGLMVLPKRIEINIPPSVTSVAEAAVGRDTIMRAVASAVLEADAAEQALLSALPLGPQTPAGGVSLPEGFCGELTVKLKEARNLPVWGFPWQSNPYCRLMLGEQAVRSRRDDDTSHDGTHKAPVWNQEFQFLVQDLSREKLEISVRDSHLTGKPDVGKISFALKDLPADGRCDVWLPLEVAPGADRNEGEVRIELTYRSFEEDEHDSGYREAELFARTTDDNVPIKDIQSAAAASSRAAVAASAAAAAIAITRAAAARAAAKAARAAKAAASGNLSSLNFDSDEDDTSNRSTTPPGTPSTPTVKTTTSNTVTSSSTSSDALKGSFLSSVGELLQAVQQDTSAKDGVVGSSTGAPAQRAVERPERERLVNGNTAPMQAETSGVNGSNGAPMNGKTPISGVAPDVLGDGPITNEQLAALLAARIQGTSIAESADRYTGVTEASPGVSSGRSDVLQSRDQMVGSTHPHHHHSHMHAHLDPKAGIVVDIDPDFGNDRDATSSSDDDSSALLDTDRAGQPSSTTYVNQAVANGDVWERSADLDMPPVNGHTVETVTGDGAEVVSAVSVMSGDGLGGSVVSMATLTAPRPTAPAAEVSTAAVATVDQVVQGADGSRPVTAAVLERETVALPKGLNGVNGSSANGNGPTGVLLQGGKRSEEEDVAREQDGVRGGAGNTIGGEELGEREQPSKQVAVAEAVKRLGGFVERDNGKVKEATAAESKEKEKEQKEGEQKEGWSWTGLFQNVVKSVEGLLPPGGHIDEAESKDEKGGQARASAAESVDSQADGSETGETEEKKGGGWWDVLPKIKLEVKWGGGSKEEREEVAEEDDGSMKDVIIPPDLPLEEIAKEVAKLKEESWKSKEDHVSSLWAKAVERNDRSWIMLLCFLVATAIFLLVFALYRIDTLPGM